MSKQGIVLMLLLGGCWRQVPCSSGPVGDEGGQDRPQVLIKGGAGYVSSVSLTVRDFYLDVFDVTVGAYAECKEMGACDMPDTTRDCNYGVHGRENHPINCVTFTQAQQFCTWARRRLPTEAEWSYAVGEGVHAYPWGDDVPVSGADAQLCWGRSQSTLGTPTANQGSCPVGRYPKTLRGTPNCDGVADLAGNVWQWLNTRYSEPYVQSDCTLGSNCVLRGGAWVDADARIVGFRLSFDPAARNVFNGFRCASSAP